VLTPGWTDFHKRVYYQTYDVTSRLQPGTNTLAAILGDGWYASDLAFTGHREFYGGKPRFLAQLIIQYSNGNRQIVVSDGSWKASHGPLLWSDLLIGSGYDARLEMPGWDTADFDDRFWAPVLTNLNISARGYADVTGSIKSLMRNDSLNIVVNNNNLEGDPVNGIAKTLKIIYSVGGINQTKSFAENDVASLSGNGQMIRIVKAFYGDAAAFPEQGGVHIEAAVTEPSRALEMIAAKKLTTPSPGCYTFDLGQNMVGWVRLNISGRVGDRISLRHGEMLNPDGTIYTANLRGATATDYYIFATNGSVVYEPRFTFHGFRYVEVRGLSVPPTLGSVTGIVVYSDLPRAGHFACSSPLVNQLFSNIIWSQKGNYLEVPTDCPQRDERMGWSGDMEFFASTAAYNYDVQSFFRRQMVAFCDDSQYLDGSYANVAPNLGEGSSAAGWQDAAWICPYVMYCDYGETNIITDHYASFQRFGKYLARHAAHDVITNLPGDFGDWLNLGGGATGKVIDTAFYAYYAKAMSEMAAAIGRDVDASTYAALHRNIVKAFAGFFNADGTFTDGSGQTGYALAFTLDLVPPSLRFVAAQKFASSIATVGNHLATGFIGTPRLLPALHLAGRDDLAYLLLLQPSYPSWLYQVNLGATTMWERWDGWTPRHGFETVGMNSFNHYAFGAVGQYLYSVIGGINPASPGYQKILIAPVPGDGLTWANTSYNSVRGLISTAWTNTGTVFSLNTVIPPNTSAQIFVPTTNPAAITESGIPAANAPGVTYVGLSNNCAVFNIGSGTYQWFSPYSRSPNVTFSAGKAGGSGDKFRPNSTAQANKSLILSQSPGSVAAKN
jgi:alpha-L-rhamnosidase